MFTLVGVVSSQSEGASVILDPAARALALKLGVGDLNLPPVCHGRACGCRCEDCEALDGVIAPQFRAWLRNDDPDAPMPRMLKRAPKQPKQPTQPWDVVKRAA